MNIKFTQEHFRWFVKYCQVRDSGRYNMITDSYIASLAAGLSKDQYFFVIKNFEALREQYNKISVKKVY